MSPDPSSAHLPDEKLKAQRGKAPYLRSHSLSYLELELEVGQIGQGIRLLIRIVNKEMKL